MSESIIRLGELYYVTCRHILNLFLLKILSFYHLFIYLFRNFSQHIYIHSYKCLHDTIGEYICDSD